MAELTEIEKIEEQLRQTATGYATLDSETLTRKNLGREASFEPLTDVFTAFQAMSKRIAHCTWKGLPLEVLRTCLDKLKEMKDPVTAIQTFNPMSSDSNPRREREQRMENFTRRWAEIYTYIAPHLGFAESVDAGAGNFKQSLADVLTEANAAKEAYQKKISDFEKGMAAEQERIKQLAQNIEKLGQQSGVTHQAGHFKTLADNYAKIAVLWVVLGLTAGLGLFFYVRDLQLPDIKDPLLLAEHLVPRLVAVTLLSTALIFCIRNFSAMMHNLIVNRHRQTALTTFQVFVNGTGDEGTKNAVLIQSTQAIFAPQPSGYLKTDQEMPQMNQVTEIIRGVAGKDK